MSLKKNAIYSSAYQIVRLIFPLITYPYVSRIIGPEGMGQVSYAQTVLNYFTSFVLLGIPVYATREISRSRAVPGLTDTVYNELLFLSVILTAVGSGIYAGFFFLFPSIAAEPVLHWGFGLVLLLHWSQLDWFFQGIENYKYITIRNFIIRALSAALVFFIIKERSHYPRYGFLWIGGTIAAYTLNFFYSLKFVKLRIRGLNLFRHLRKSLPSAFISGSAMLYAVIDVIMLGSMLNDNRYAVGIYSVAGRLMRIAMSVVIAGNIVIGPRISLRHEQGAESEIIRILKLNVSLILLLGIPAVVGMMCTAEELMGLFAGSEFAPAVLTMRIIAPELLILSITGILGNQILYARGKEKRVLIVTIISLIVAVITNFIAIPKYQENGAAVATVFTRLVEMILLGVMGWDLLKKVIDVKDLVKTMILAVSWALLLLFFQVLVHPLMTGLRFASTAIFGIISYALFAFFIRTEASQKIIDWVSRK
ncbi:MAG: flippase [Bacteroidales bacterium]|nr:flippase [Bacteroidales bacterium]